MPHPAKNAPAHSIAPTAPAFTHAKASPTVLKLILHTHHSKLLYIPASLLHKHHTPLRQITQDTQLPLTPLHPAYKCPTLVPPSTTYRQSPSQSRSLFCSQPQEHPSRLSGRIQHCSHLRMHNTHPIRSISIPLPSQPSCSRKKANHTAMTIFIGKCDFQ